MTEEFKNYNEDRDDAGFAVSGPAGAPGDGARRTCACEECADAGCACPGCVALLSTRGNAVHDGAPDARDAADGGVSVEWPVDAASVVGAASAVDAQAAERPVDSGCACNGHAIDESVIGAQAAESLAERSADGEIVADLEAAAERLDAGRFADGRPAESAEKTDNLADAERANRDMVRPADPEHPGNPEHLENPESPENSEHSESPENPESSESPENPHASPTLPAIITRFGEIVAVRVPDITFTSDDIAKMERAIASGAFDKDVVEAPAYESNLHAGLLGDGDGNDIIEINEVEDLTGAWGTPPGTWCVRRPGLCAVPRARRAMPDAWRAQPDAPPARPDVSNALGGWGASPDAVGQAGGWNPPLADCDARLHDWCAVDNLERDDGQFEWGAMSDDCLGDGDWGDDDLGDGVWGDGEDDPTGGETARGSWRPGGAGAGGGTRWDGAGSRGARSGDGWAHDSRDSHIVHPSFFGAADPAPEPDSAADASDVSDIHDALNALDALADVIDDGADGDDGAGTGAAGAAGGDDDDDTNPDAASDPDPNPDNDPDDAGGPGADPDPDPDPDPDADPDPDDAGDPDNAGPDDPDPTPASAAKNIPVAPDPAPYDYDADLDPDRIVYTDVVDLNGCWKFPFEPRWDPARPRNAHPRDRRPRSACEYAGTFHDMGIVNSKNQNHADKSPSHAGITHTRLLEEAARRLAVCLERDGESSRTWPYCLWTALELMGIEKPRPVPRSEASRAYMDDSPLYMALPNANVRPRQRHTMPGLRYVVAAFGPQTRTIGVGMLEDSVRCVDAVDTWIMFASHLSLEELVVLGDSMMRREYLGVSCRIEEFERRVESLRAMGEERSAGGAGGVSGRGGRGGAQGARGPRGTSGAGGVIGARGGNAASLGSAGPSDDWRMPRGLHACEKALRLMRECTDSSQETRLRLALMRCGLDEPQVNHMMKHPKSGKPLFLDLAYPELKIAIEYDGMHHARQWLADSARRTAIEDAGWMYVQVTKDDLADLDAERELARRVAERMSRCVGHTVRLRAEATTEQLADRRRMSQRRRPMWEVGG